MESIGVDSVIDSRFLVFEFKLYKFNIVVLHTYKLFFSKFAVR
jgi:hypothetical protein